MPKKKSTALKKKRTIETKKKSSQKKSLIKKKRIKKKIGLKKSPKVLSKINNNLKNQNKFLTKNDLIEIAIMIGGLSFVTSLMFSIF